MKQNDTYRFRQTHYPQLADEIPSSSTWSRIAITVILTIVVILLINFFWMWFLDVKNPNPADYLIAKQWEKVQSISESVDWLILGDSTADYDIVSDIIANELAGTSVNVATVGNWMLIDDEWMLEYLIINNKAPKNIIIMSAYDTLDRQLTLSMLAQAPFTETFWSQFSLDLGLSTEDRINIYLAKLFPLYSRDVSIHVAILNIIQNPGLLFEEQDMEGSKNSEILQPEDVTLDLGGQLDFLNTQEFSFVNPINDQAIDIMLRLIDEHDIKMYVVASPIYDELAKLPKYQAYYAHVDEWWSAVASRSENVYYIQKQETYPIGLMANSDHLNIFGRKIFTTELSQKIRDIVESVDTQ